MPEQTGSRTRSASTSNYGFDFQPPEGASSERDQEVARCARDCSLSNTSFIVEAVENLATRDGGARETTFIHICRAHRTARLPEPGAWESLTEKARDRLRHEMAKAGLRLTHCRPTTSNATSYDRHCALACAHWEHRETGIRAADGHTITLVFRICDSHGRAHLPTGEMELWESLDPTTREALRYRLMRDGYHIVTP